MPYQIYELKLKPQSPWISDLTADTIFGHLCWQFGKEVLEQFLEEMSIEPIFTISDVLPSDRLPRPLSEFDGDMGEQKELDFNRNKRYKEVDMINFSNFNKYYCSKNLNIDNIKNAKINLTKDLSKYFDLNIDNKNIINRNTGTTSDGGIYSEENNISTGLNLSLFIKIFDLEKFKKYEIIELLKNIFELTGFGKKKSTGKGLFKIENINENFKESFYGDKNIEDFKNYILLSNFIPSENDSTNGNYKVFTKFPKMGEENSIAGQNFYKKPLIMLESGATFEKWENYKGYVGKIIKNVDFQNKGISHYAYGFTLEF